LVSAYETDRHLFSAEMAVRFALALGVSLDDLLHPDARKTASKQPSLKVQRRIEQIEGLPLYEQRALLTTIDKFLAAAQSS
jgi:transcriptional regulator with XRE-family HTH domain